MEKAPLILVVDDDETGLRFTIGTVESAGYRVRSFHSAYDLLAYEIAKGDLIVSDIRMPGLDGLQLQDEVRARGHVLPIVFVTGHGDVELAVRAMKAGAVDFLEKPFDDEVMLASVARALERSRHARSQDAEAAAAQKLLAVLTPRERSVLEQLVAGRSNKLAAHELGISPRTVEIHRAHIMDKMNARSLSDLVRVAISASARG